MYKTSTSHPLGIDAVRLPVGHGCIGLTQRWVRRLDVLDAACDLLAWAAPAWSRAAGPEARP